MRARGGVVALALLAACAPRRAPEPPAEGPPSAATPWVRARAPEDVSLLEMPARVLVAPGAQAVVAPPYPARVLRVLVVPGQAVARGAPLVEVAMPRLVQAAGELQASRTRIEAYRRRQTQLEALRQEGLARTTEIAETETRLAEARADHTAALATLRAAGVGPEAAPALLRGGGFALRSPIAGLVTEVDATVGETREGGGPPLVRVAGAGPPRVEARLSHPLPPGARFALVTPGGEAVPVELVAQAPTVDPRDGTRPAWFRPARPEALPAGLTARLKVLLPPGSAVVVPAAAVGGETDAWWVLRRRADGGAARVPVRLLLRSGADAVVAGEVAAGDEVAADVLAATAGDGGAP